MSRYIGLVAVLILIFLSVVYATVPTSEKPQEASTSANLSQVKIAGTDQIRTKQLPESSPIAEPVNVNPSKKSLVLATLAFYYSGDQKEKLTKQFANGSDNLTQATNNLAIYLDKNPDKSTQLEVMLDKYIADKPQTNSTPPDLPQTSQYASTFSNSIPNNYQYGGSYSPAPTSHYDTRVYPVITPTPKPDITVLGGADTYTKYGNTVFGNDGSTYTQYGNTVFGNNGTSYTKYGNTIFGSDGTTSTKYGNTTFNNDGTSFTQYGNTLFGSDGSSYTQYGNTVFRHPGY